MCPDVTRSKHARHSATLLFPEPDSPTSASVLPGKIENEMESTAVNPSPRLPNDRGAYRFTRFSTRIVNSGLGGSTSGSASSSMPLQRLTPGTSSRQPHDRRPTPPSPAPEPGIFPFDHRSAARIRSPVTTSRGSAALPQLLATGI